MNNAFQIIERLKSMLGIILGERKILQGEVSRLKQELSSLQAENKSLRQQLTLSREDLKFTDFGAALKEKVATGTSSSVRDNAGLRKQMDRMIADLDKCIARLSGSDV